MHSCAFASFLELRQQISLYTQLTTHTCQICTSAYEYVNKYLESVQPSVGQHLCKAKKYKLVSLLYKHLGETQMYIQDNLIIQIKNKPFCRHNNDIFLRQLPIPIN